MRIVAKRFYEWPQNVQRSLVRATLPDGSMRPCVRKNPRTRTLVAFEHDCVLGWMLLWPTAHGTFATVFVNKRYRGRGIAPALFARAFRLEHPLHVLAWDDSSRKLFQGVSDAHPGMLVIRDWVPFREANGQLQHIGTEEGAVKEST